MVGLALNGVPVRVMVIFADGATTSSRINPRTTSPAATKYRGRGPPAKRLRAAAAAPPAVAARDGGGGGPGGKRPPAAVAPSAATPIGPRSLCGRIVWMPRSKAGTEAYVGRPPTRESSWM